MNIGHGELVDESSFERKMGERWEDLGRPIEGEYGHMEAIATVYW